MASPQLIDLLLALVRSPRGLLALTGVLGSLAALVYLFVLKPVAGKARSKKAAASTAKRPAKQTSKAASKKPASASKQPSAKSPAKKETVIAKKADQLQASKSESAKKSSKVAAAVKGSPTKSEPKPAAKAKGAAKQSPASAGKKSDEGEWITVAKKKPRSVGSSSKKLDEENQAGSPKRPNPVTRSAKKR